MLSNEQLCNNLQYYERGTQPYNDTISKLYLQNVKFLNMMASRFYYSNLDMCASYGITLDDLKQEMYFVVEPTARAYIEHKQFKYITYINYQFKILLRQIFVKNPMNDASSIDEPINYDPDAPTFAEVMPDKDTNVEQETINNIIDNAVFEITKDILKDDLFAYAIIEAFYQDEKNIKQIALEMRSSEQVIKQSKTRAMRELRRHTYIYQNYYYQDVARKYSTSLNAFKNTQASAVEKAVIFIDQNKRRERLKTPPSDKPTTTKFTIHFDPNSYLTE